jgi:hypothetical protein
VIVWEAVVGSSLAYQSMAAAKTLFLDVCDHLPPRLLKLPVKKSLLLG